MKTDTSQKQTTIPDHLIPIQMVAACLNLSTRAVYRLVAKGELAPPVKIGSATRFCQSDLDDYLSRLKAARPTI